MRQVQHDARWSILACVYAGYILVATLYPFEITWNAQQSIAGIFRPTGLRDFVLNILLFVPFGIFCYRRIALSTDPARAVLVATLVGSIFSTGIEVVQVAFNRHPSAFDVLSNTLGASLGAVLFARWQSHFANLAFHFGPRSGAFAVLGCCGVLLFGATPLLLTIAQFSAPFRIWDWRHTLQIANEATLDRPWLGKIHFVALYNRALSAQEIRANFYQGAAPPAPEARAGLLALYKFTEGGGNVVHDVSEHGSRLDLTISPERHVRWLEDSNGIEILKPAVLKNDQAGVRLVTAANTTHELTIEAWITPRDTMQAGPARIISFSRNGGARNFTLGQHRSQIQFRLRTPVSGKNGTPLSLASDGLSGAERSHIVATYKDGIERLYIDGKERPHFLNLTSDGIIAFGTRKTPVAQLAYTFFYFFPLSFILAVFYSRSPTPLGIQLLVPAAMGTGMLMSTELLQVFAFRRELDFYLIAYGLTITTLATLSGRALRLNIVDR